MTDPPSEPIQRRRFEPVIRNAAAARGFLREVTEGLAADQEALILAGSEAAANAIRHARTPFDVAVTVDGMRVRVEVTDGDASLPVVAPVDLAEPGGFGMRIIARLASLWGVDPFPGGKTVWFEVPMHRTEAPEMEDRRNTQRGETA